MILIRVNLLIKNLFDSYTQKNTYMKKIYTRLLLFGLLIASFYLTSTSQAQITITREDMPETGIMVIRVIDTLTNSSPGSNGPDQRWDFSANQSSYTDTIRYLLVSEVPDGDEFQTANLVEGRIMDDPSGKFHNYSFYDVRDNGIYGLGWILSLEIPTISSYYGVQTYDETPLIIPLPLTYSLENEETSIAHLYSNTTIMGIEYDSSHVKSIINVTQVVDGHGTLITPIGTYIALRMVETSTTIDSTFSYLQETGWDWVSTDTTEQTTYRWFAKDVGEVATLYEDNETNEFHYFIKSQVTDVEKILHNVDLKIYPNPSNDMLQIETDKAIKYIQIMSLNGQLMTTTQNNNIDVSQLSTGVYIVKVYINEGVITRKFVKN